MCKSIQAEMEHWRVILLRQNASELLVFQTVSGLNLPRVDIPAHGRVAQSLNAQVKARWGLDVYSLYPLPATNVSGATVPYHVIEALGHETPTPHEARWISITDVKEGCFVEFRDFAAVQTWIDNLARGNTNGHRSPFEKPGWFPVLRSLIQEAIQAVPLTLSGGFLQLNASPCFSLIRFETDSDAISFKAVGEPNLREYGVSQTLARLFPSYVPKILATKPEWHGWLMEDAGGTSLNETLKVAVAVVPSALVAVMRTA